MVSLRASAIGREIIKNRRKELNWRYRDPRWAVEVGKILEPELDWGVFAQCQPFLGVSKSTMHRYQHGNWVRENIFVAMTTALGLDIHDIIETSHTSNLILDLSSLVQEKEGSSELWRRFSFLNLCLFHR
jgi:hypothetical protein